MKKNPGRKERRRIAHQNRVALGRLRSMLEERIQISERRGKIRNSIDNFGNQKKEAHRAKTGDRK